MRFSFLSLGRVVAMQSLVTAAASLPQQIPITTDVHVRQAVEADLDDIVTVFIDAFAPGPIWQYVYPHLAEHYEFTWQCVRKDLGQQFARLDNKSFCNVIPHPHAPADGSMVTSRGHELSRVVAVAIWGVREPENQGGRSSLSFDALDLSGSLASCSNQPAINYTRAADQSQQWQAAMSKYVLESQEKQFYLGGLVTHPDWDGHGFAARHLCWGIDKSKSIGEGLPITLFGTPAGWPLYDSMGFQSLQNVTITTLAEDMDDLWVEFMRFDHGD